MDKKCQIIIDPDRAPIVKQVFEKFAHDEWSGRKIYHWLRFDLNFKSVGNHHVALGNIYTVLNNPLYYGRFEYPRDSGNWYNGKHEPIISKELFDKAQERMKRASIVRHAHEFAFTKLMICGLCGSGISAEEKYKQLKDGTVAKYIYYGCGRAKDRHCKNPYLREDELTEQLVKIIDKIDIGEIGVQHKFQDELKRYNKFHRTVLGITNVSGKHKEIDMRTYAKYILREGSNEEKRELMGCFKSKLRIAKQVLTIE